MRRLKAKWTRKDGWKAKQFVCTHSAGLVNLTLYYKPVSKPCVPTEHKGYTMSMPGI